MFYVYILYSKSSNLYYKGFTTDLIKRLENHLSGKSKYTSTKTDWILVYSKEFEIKKEALIEEKRLKKLNRASIEKLISNN
ncbi:GIY-YIG nuclease family protein [Flavobacterium sp.]|jgi:putative endonuclease|uniref:GIY-YIG nuclease family protein n=1 Tax=Flavobacterium sp. TaxID=239 RepID=UPI0037C0E232